ncbi:excitatory amino acid transporter 5 isoform X1 [Falco biarmicus]|uniref:excitatory amino acid transporter 5 isoform X1 n=1 Tax=Falco peregrinus TaxID=8954 RepID=UPI0003871C28|nr:excitatory amino acid transporter 5 isoform X1 [Falco peregrinus]XP_005440425.1 excitatory amino acid transporter 5 isoform X1 [Falco cherrug]XP_037260442.1 excitatory amino acid transporter 5 isoform X1 [Falco rusticolus]XP_056212663.1 excitatory amino acid transporter 5 isoform X1 [Falco biarmicus]
MAVALDAILARIKDVCKRNGLLILSVLSVTIGCLLGFFLRTRRLSQQEISYFQFPGELLMRMLKMLILPLVVSSLMSGLAALDAKTSSRLGIITVTYYLWTTFVAVIVGIVMVSIIHPGGAAQKESTEEGGKPIMSSADALLDLIRNMFPANLVEATFKQYRTKSIPIIKSNKASSESTTRRIIIYGIQDENGSNVQNFALDITPPPEVIYKSEPGTSDGMNVLGIVIFSATMGIMLGRMGNSGVPLVSFCQCLNESVMKIVAVAVWYFPFGIVFLIAGKILEMDDPSAIGKKLGFYAITVVCGLVVHGLFILPMMYFFITKKNPIVFIRGILQALLIALATSSSSATLPITFKCLLENNHVDRRIARFVLPVGATINMDGTALYEAVAAIFIAQVNNYELDFGQIITISITATAASIGAAGIPQAGLVTMVIVLTSVGLPTDDITLIIAVDWALDRFRTMINVLGDALAAGIMAHICRKEFIKDGDEVPLICETKPINVHQIVAYQRNGCVKTMNESRGPETVKGFQHHIPVQVEQEESPVENHTKKSNSKDHCTIEINELETNV